MQAPLLGIMPAVPVRVHERAWVEPVPAYALQLPASDPFLPLAEVELILMQTSN